MKGWSLQEFLLQELIDLSGRPDREAVVAQLRSRLAGRKPVTVDAIVAARSADRR